MKTKFVKSPKPRSLTTTLAISFIGLSAVVLLISNGLQIALSIRTQQSAITNQQQLIAGDAGKTVSNFIEEKLGTLETAATFSRLTTASSEERVATLQGMLGIDHSFEQVAMYNNRGLLQAYASRSSESPTPQFTSQLTDDTYAALSSGERYYVGPVYIDEETAEPFVTLAVPYKTPAGVYQGLILTEISLKFIWDLVDNINVGETGYVYLVDDQGNLIAYEDRSRVLAGENVSHISEVDEFLENPTEEGDPTPDIVAYTGLNGEAVLGSYVPLGTLPWALLVELPRKEAYQNIVALAWQSGILILIMAVLAGVVGYLGARSTATPLVELSNAATDFANGNLDTQAHATGALELVQLANSFNNMTTQLRDSIDNLETRVAERTAEAEQARQLSERRAKQFQSIAQVARTVSSTLDFNSLLTQITTVISREFGFYHVGVFLLDPTKEFAVLGASNSEGGQVMLARGHRLKVGEKGLVGFVSSTGKPRVALDTGADAVFFNNPDLPNTRSEIALPLRAGEAVIGVLDVQSTEPNAFSQEDVAVLTTLGDQVSIAIQNARQNEETQRALAESDVLSRQFVQTGWDQFTKRQNLLGVRHSGAKSTLIYAKNGKGENGHSANQPKPKGRGAVLSIPIQLRGQEIGSVDVRAPDNRQWDQDELDIVTAIIERAAIAMENARLLAESQKRAAKERTIGEISAKISAKSDIEELIKTAAQELTQTLPGTEVAIQFRKEETE